MKKALIIFVLLCAITVTAACSQNEGGNETEYPVEYLNGKIKFTDRLPDTASPYDGMSDCTAEYKWSSLSGPVAVGEEYSFITNLFCFYVDGSPASARTLCADPFCRHRWGESYCITSYEYVCTAPVGKAVYTAADNKVLYYNLETYEFYLYAEFNENINDIFSMGRYLYIVFTLRGENGTEISDMYSHYIRVDTLTNTAEHLSYDGKIGEPEIHDDMIYFRAPGMLKRVNSRLEEQPLESAPDCGSFHLFKNLVFYIPNEEYYGDQLWAYDLIGNTQVRMLDNIRSFTVASDKLYVIHYEEGGYEANINVKLFIYDDNDRINLISANTDTEYTIAHSSLVDNRSGNWCINIESPSYIFVYLSRNEGQLSWGDIIKTDIGNVVSMERNLSMGNHAVAVNNTAIYICPYSLKEGSTKAENKIGNESYVYICAYNADPRKDCNARLLDCYLLKLVQVKDYSDEYSYTHSCKAVLTKSTFDFSRITD